MSKNRRQFVRVAPARVKEVDAKIIIGKCDVPCLVNDISEGGLGLKLPANTEELELFQRIQCTIGLPEPASMTLTVKAEVRHLQGDLLGVQFAWLGKDHRDIIHRFIRDNLDDESLVTKVKFTFGLLR